jgi:type IV secretion system protein VirB1
MRLGTLTCFFLLLGFVTNAQAQLTHARLSDADFVSLARRCAPGAPADTLLAIARTESALNANAISINRPNAAARRAGYSDGQLVLTKQPNDRTEATNWLHWFLLRRYTVSIGLMQVNSEMAPHFHVKPDQLLEPCTNLRIGAAILISVYTDLAREMGEGFSALDVALSFYNTGNPTAGFRNGYVANVYAHAPRRSAIFSP